MPRTKKYITKLAVGSNFDMDDHPASATVELLPSMIVRIRELSEVVKKNSLYKVELFDYTPTWYTTEDCDKEWEDGEDRRIGCVTMNVSSDTVWWTASAKHSDYEFSTDSINIKELS